MTKKDEVLRICRNIDSCVNLNGLTTVDDSVKLCLVIMECSMLIRVIPHAMMYRDPTAKEAKHPKMV